ncbi:exopolysaccharide biosynthesis protein [Catenovulum agarivorans]|uniref:exopolysaccharide biosynthesis protein n=1 Tax=Catenovulum agarivorans TaxID=1172192 RepID=UPI00192BCEAD|nr:exopolysaccharide biosynthesis protein [Catenovulum agarivorans]
MIEGISTLQNKSNTHRSLFSVPERPRTRTSDVLILLIAKSKQSSNISLRALTDRMADRTFGILLIVISIFNVIPFASLIAGLLIICLGLQMSFGRTQAWLPSVILDRKLDSNSVIVALQTFEPKIRTIEQYLRPRLQFTEAYIVDRINGLIIALLGAIITLPIPLTNIAPALIVIVMGLGLLERDGLVQLIAAFLGICIMVGFSLLIL